MIRSEINDDDIQAKSMCLLKIVYFQPLLEVYASDETSNLMNKRRCAKRRKYEN